MKKVDFDHGKLTQNILQTALPLFVAQVLSLLYSIVDRVYIGRIPGSGTQALGAIGLCFPIIILIAGFTNMFGMGGAPLYAMELGKGDHEKARQIQNTAFRLLLIIAVVILVMGEAAGKPLLRLFGATPAEIPASLSYLRIYLLGTPALMLCTGLNPYINAQGYSLVSMLSVGAGAVANLILDPLFIFGLGMEIRGAALATVLSQILAMGITLQFFMGKQNEHPLHFAFRFPFAWDIVSLGTAPFIMQVTNSLVQIACNNVLMQFGGAAFVSVMTIVSSVRSILDVPVMALTEGASPIISYNYGARRPRKVKGAMKFTILISFAYTLFVWAVLFFHPRFFVRIFSSDESLMQSGSRALHLYFYAFIFQSLQYSGQMVFKALNKRGKAIFFSLLRKAVLVVPLTFLLPHLFGLGTDGVFLAEPISNVIGGTACFVTMLATVLPELAGMEKTKR